MSYVKRSREPATRRRTAGGPTEAVRLAAALAHAPAAGTRADFPDPPVWAPIEGFPAAFVPVAFEGLRFWDEDGPAQLPPGNPPPRQPTVYRRLRNRRLVAA